MEYISVSILIAALGVIISFAVFFRNKTKEDKSEGRQNGVICTELGYIKARIDEIKAEQKEQRRINMETSERLVKVEASDKQAHLRINRMEGSEHNDN